MRVVELNKEELALGFIAGLAFVCFAKWWVLVTAPACAFLWALSGAEGEKKFWRRAGVPIIMAFSAFGTHAIGALSAALGCAVLTVGYGIPDETDEGSWLGRLFSCGCEECFAEDGATLAVRFVLSYFLWLVFMPAASLNLEFYFVAGLILMVFQPLAVKFIEGRIKIVLPF